MSSTVSPNEQDIFIFYAREGTISELKELIDSVDINAEDSFNNTTALIEATKHNHAKMVEYLCQQPSIQLDHETPNSEIALMEATKNNSPIIADILLRHGANVNVQLKQGKVTPLHEACRKGYVEMIEVLKKYKADPLIVDDEKNTPNNYLPENLKDKLVKYINSFGSKKNQREKRKSNGRRSRNIGGDEDSGKESNKGDEDDIDESQSTPIRSGRKPSASAITGAINTRGSRKQQKTRSRTLREFREIPLTYKRLVNRILCEEATNFYNKMTDVFLEYVKTYDEEKSKELSDMIYSEKYESLYLKILESTEQAPSADRPAPAEQPTPMEE